MLEHHSGIETAIPHFRRTVTGVLQMEILFQPFIAAFRRCAVFIGVFPSGRIAGRKVKKPGIIFACQMNGSAEFGSGAGILAGANAGGTVHKRAAVLRAVLGILNAIGTHSETGAANRDSVGADGEIVFVDAGSAAFRVEINKRRNVLFAAIFINCHSVMSRVEEECGNLEARQKSLHGEEALEEAQGIMAGSGVEQRKNRQIAERIRGGEQVEAVTVVVAASMRVPADIAVRLGVIAVAVTVGNPQLPAIAQAFLPLPGGGNDGSAVAGKGQSVSVYEAPLDRFLQKQLLKHLEEEGEGLLPGRRNGLEFGV